jgi:hypothetical protein
VLDVVVEPDLSWRWKDREEFDEKPNIIERQAGRVVLLDDDDAILL